jgi:uncharacterized protein (TIGR02118 family)
MIVRFGTAPRRIGLGIDEFQAHWRGKHGDLAVALPGVNRYWQNHAILRDGENILPWPGFDACSQFEFDDLQTMDAAFATEHALTALRADEQFLVDKPRGGMVLAETVKLEGRIDVNCIRLLTFLRCGPQRTVAALGKALDGLPNADPAIGREIYLALDGRAAGQRNSMFDAVEILWFETSEDAERYACSAEARDRRHEIGDLVRGTERLIAKIHVVR